MLMRLEEIEKDIIRNKKLASRLAYGEISFEKYKKERDLTPKTKIEEIGDFLNKEGFLDFFLNRLSIGARCLVMRDVFELNYRKILDNTKNYSTSKLSDFFNDHLDRKSTLSKESSFNFIYQLAIILDIPAEYLLNHKVEYKMTYSFEEYERLDSEVISLLELMKKIKNNMKDLPIHKRKIMGVKLKRDDLFIHEADELYARVDIREEWFTIEIHFHNKFSINKSIIKSISNTIGMKNRIYVRDAFLRDNKKLIILVTTIDSFNFDVKYLHEDMLMDKRF